VPKLALATVGDGTTPPTTPPSTSPCTIQTQIRVLMNVPDMQTDDDMVHIGVVHDAKKALATRTDVTYYITAEDLIEIQRMDSPVRLRLHIDHSKTHRSRTSLESTRGRSTSIHVAGRTSSPTRPKLKHNKSVDSSECSPMPSRKSDPRKYATVPNVLTPSYVSGYVSGLQADTTPIISVNIPTNTTNTITTNNTNATNDINHKHITLRSGMFRIMYEQSSKTYQYFIVEEYERGRLICRGLTDMEIRGDVLITYEYSTINNPNAKLSATIYSENLMKATMPIYLHVCCDQEITIERIVEMLPDLIDLAQTQYNANDLSHVVDTEIKQGWKPGSL